MKSFESVARTKETHPEGEQHSSSPFTTQRKEYAGRTSFPIQRMSDAAIGNAGVIQFTKATAAEELFKAGTITVKKTHFKAPFNKKHGVTVADLDDVQVLLADLRDKAPKKEKPKTIDMSVKSNWPTAGGMNEGDGKVVAESLGWTEDLTKWTCKDKSHTPKGKVYTDGSSYYGADNTGHVGWGFKVWVVERGKLLDYKGNISWNGNDWVHDKRGTK